MPESSKGFTAAGVNMFDKNGNIRPVSTLLEELSDRFAKAYATSGDAGVVKLRNQFAGSEGINALLNTAADRAATFKDQLRNFADSELELARVREIAKDDAVLLSEELRNRLNVAVTQLGESLLPLKVALTETALAAVNGTRLLFSEGARRTSGADAFRQLLENADVDAMTPEQRNAFLTTVRERRDKAYSDARKYQNRADILKWFWLPGYLNNRQRADMSMGFAEAATDYLTMPFFGRHRLHRVHGGQQ